MIYCLTGELLHLDGTNMTAVIDCAGVGYRVTLSGSATTKLSNSVGEKVRVFTYLALREDAAELYGFSETGELDLFKLLISVSGVGPKAAISILSVLSHEALIYAIAGEDSKAISKAPGVGAKTAARVVLELHDKIAKNFVVPTESAAPAKKGAPAKAVGGHLSDARDALIVLGYTRSEIANALSGLDPTSPTEELIRLALSKLAVQ